MIVQGHTAHQAWQELLRELLAHGHRVQPRGLACFELLGVQLRLTDARENIIVNPKRGLNYRFMVAEWLWTLLGRNDLASVARYNPVMRQFSDDGQTLAGAYGPRLLDQWDSVTRALLGDIQSRQAVAGIWRWPQRSSKDVPCTLALQFLLRPDHDGTPFLHTVVSMRSSDAWLGIPYDIFNFTMLASYLAAYLSDCVREPIKLGELIMNLGSAHLYERDLPGAHQAREAAFYGYTVPSPTLAVQPTWLERVFDSGFTNFPADDCPPWDAYARCLHVPSSKDALEVLRAAAK